MIQKSKKIIMFAVIATVMVAVPISFTYLYFSPQSPEMVAFNGSTSYVWNVNCDYPTPNNSISTILTHNITVSSWIDQPGYRNSSITMVLRNSPVPLTVSFYCPAESDTQFVYDLIISGNLSSNIRAPSLTFCQRDAYNGTIAGGVLGCFAQSVNMSKVPNYKRGSPPEYCTIRDPSLSTTVTFENNSKVLQNGTFHFALYLSLPFKTLNGPLILGKYIESFFKVSLNFTPVPVNVSMEITVEARSV
ncbi:MAG: hypothetical protein AAE986_07875 [Thermoplasmataceae archaeon]|jgi:hypothetical protein